VINYLYKHDEYVNNEYPLNLTIWNWIMIRFLQIVFNKFFFYLVTL